MVWRSFCDVYYRIEDFNSEEIVGTFYKNQLQKTNQTEFRTEINKVELEKKRSDYIEYINATEFKTLSNGNFAKRI